MAEKKLTPNQTRFAMRKRKTTQKSTNQKHPGGRPTKYKPEFAEQVYKLTLEGYTDKDIADFYKVREQTINNWKNAHPEFFESLKRGKDDYDSNVIEKSLAKRAAGYQYIETTKTITEKGKKVIIKEVVKEVAPDPTSMIFWLKNRKPARWRDKQNIEHSGKIENEDAALAAGLEFLANSVDGLTRGIPSMHHLNKPKNRGLGETSETGKE